MQWRATRIWRKGNAAASKAETVDGATASERREQAVASLERLVQLRRIGLVGPIPLFGRVTAKILAAVEKGLASPAHLIVCGLEGWTIYNSHADGDEAPIKCLLPDLLRGRQRAALQARGPEPAPRHRGLEDARVLAHRVRGAAGPAPGGRAMTAHERHVLTDPLPGDGLLCVEASAGTGKTHLLSTLAARGSSSLTTSPSPTCSSSPSPSPRPPSCAGASGSDWAQVRDRLGAERRTHQR